MGDRDDQELSRLVVVATERAKWQLGDGGPPGVARAIERLFGAERGGGIWVASEGGQRPVGGFGSEASAGRVEAQRQLDQFTNATARPTSTVAAAAKLLAKKRIRLLMDPSRLASTLGQRDARWTRRFCAVVLEIEPQFADPTLFAHVTLALFTHRPHLSEFRPPARLHAPDEPLDAGDVRHILGDFTGKIRPAFDRWLTECGYSPFTIRVFGRASRAPAFVVAAAQDVDRPWPTVAAPLARSLLQADVGDLGVGTSTFAQGITVVRRLVPATIEQGERDEDRPLYLAVPERVDGVGRAVNSRQEAASAQLIRLMAGVEMSAAASLNELDTRFERLGSAVEMYESVAAQAGDLWDALALHLSGRGALLRQAHRSVELLHHTLLQGVADLAQTATEIREQLEHVDNVADEIRERIRRSASEHPTDGDGVTESILRGGYFDRLRELGMQRQAKARNVRETYDALLLAMGRAFDERRARESDAVEKSALPIGVTAGLLGLVTVVQTTVQVEWELPPAAEWAVRAVCWSLGIVSIVALWWIFRSVRRVSRLASEGFETDYTDLELYLRDSSTVRLNEFEPVRGKKPRTTQQWATLDDQLSRRFAELWDRFFAHRKNSAGEAESSADIHELRRRTEEFCLRALLISERPRDFSHYKLPALTTLYQACRSDLFVTQDRAAVALVSDIEFRTVLQQAGVPDAEIDRIGSAARAAATPSPPAAGGPAPDQAVGGSAERARQLIVTELAAWATTPPAAEGPGEEEKIAS